MLPRQVWRGLAEKTQGGSQFIAAEVITAEPATPRAATASKQDTAFKRDYYAVKSHCIPIIVPRLDLSDPQSRHLKIIAFEIIAQ